LGWVAADGHSNLRWNDACCSSRIEDHAEDFRVSRTSEEWVDNQ
jgi:hypothetical protein